MESSSFSLQMSDGLWQTARNRKIRSLAYFKRKQETETILRLRPALLKIETLQGSNSMATVLDVPPNHTVPPSPHFFSSFNCITRVLLDSVRLCLDHWEKSVNLMVSVVHMALFRQQRAGETVLELQRALFAHEELLHVHWRAHSMPMGR